MYRYLWLVLGCVLSGESDFIYPKWIITMLPSLKLLFRCYGRVSRLSRPLQECLTSVSQEPEVTKLCGSHLKEESVLTHSTDVYWVVRVPGTVLRAGIQQGTKAIQALDLAVRKLCHSLLLKTAVMCAHTKSLLTAYLEIGVTFAIGPCARSHCASPTSLITQGLYVPLKFYYPSHRSILVEKNTLAMLEV